MRLRERAWRLFASEYNAATHTWSEGGERSPMYVVTPLGALVNRLFFVGVLTEAEALGGGSMQRARVSDPTDTWVIYAGQYQPIPAQTLASLKPPALIAVVGKVHVYSPEEGVVYPSVRPEIVREVGPELRDYWILEASGETLKRAEATSEALKMSPPEAPKLAALGYDEQLSKGVVMALNEYGQVDVDPYAGMVKDVLRWALSTPTKEGAEVEGDEGQALEIIRSLDEGNGAPWDGVVAEAAKHKMDEEHIEVVVSALLAKGILYEPTLGYLRVSE